MFILYENMLLYLFYTIFKPVVVLMENSGIKIPCHTKNRVDHAQDYNEWWYINNSLFSCLSIYAIKWNFLFESHYYQKHAKLCMKNI